MATSQESEIVSIKCDPDLDLNIVSIKCDHCNISFDSEEEWDLHLKSGHSADDQVLISSLLGNFKKIIYKVKCTRILSIFRRLVILVSSTKL